jgi:hypothetical protein
MKSYVAVFEIDGRKSENVVGKFVRNRLAALASRRRADITSHPDMPLFPDSDVPLVGTYS